MFAYEAMREIFKFENKTFATQPHPTQNLPEQKTKRWRV